MYLNPYYVVANVIFYDEQRKYVHVERKVWNLIVNKMKSSGPLEPKTISYFKRELYNLYITYLKTGKINVDLFNQVWCKVSNRTYRSVRQFQLINETDEEEPLMLFDESLNSDTLDRVYIEQENTLMPTLRRLGVNTELVSHQMDFVKSFRDNFDIYWNLNLSMSPAADELFTFVSYGRLKNIFLTLATRGYVDLNSLVEYIIVVSSHDMLKETIKVFPNRLNFVCETCLTVNKHKHKPKVRGDTDLLHNELIREEHKDKVLFFDHEEFYDLDLWTTNNKQLIFKEDETIIFDYNSKISPHFNLKYREENLKLQEEFNKIGTPGFLTRDRSYQDIKTFVDSLPEVINHFYDKKTNNYWNLDFLKDIKYVKNIDNGVVSLQEEQKEENNIENISQENEENNSNRPFGSIFGKNSSSPFMNRNLNNISGFKSFNGLL